VGNRSIRSAVGFVLAFLFALELSTRVDQAIRFDAPLFGLYTYDSALFDHDEFGIHGRPHARYEKWTLNGLGLRGPEADATPTAGRTRIVTLGASETFGLFESDGKEWPRVLERELAARGDRVEVLNGALAGMTVGAQLRHFRHRLLPLHPDVVVWVVHHAAFAGLDPARIDALADARPEPAPPPGWKAYFVPRALQKVRETLLPRLPAPIVEAIETTRIRSNVARLRSQMGDRFGSIDTLSTGEIAAFDHFLSTLVRESRAAGARVVVVLPPHRLDEKSLRIQTANFPYVTKHWLVEAFETFAEHAAEAGRAGDCQVADLRELFGDDVASMMTDMVHYTDAGAERIGRAVAPCVVASDCRWPEGGVMAQDRSLDGGVP
jgi:lysophospholipase L1-like esterase